MVFSGIRIYVGVCFIVSIHSACRNSTVSKTGFSEAAVNMDSIAVLSCMNKLYKGFEIAGTKCVVRKPGDTSFSLSKLMKSEKCALVFYNNPADCGSCREQALLSLLSIKKRAPSATLYIVNDAENDYKEIFGEKVNILSADNTELPELNSSWVFLYRDGFLSGCFEVNNEASTYLEGWLKLNVLGTIINE